MHLRDLSGLIHRGTRASSAQPAAASAANAAAAPRPSVDDVLQAEARLRQRLSTEVDGHGLAGPVTLSAVVARDLCKELIHDLDRLATGELTGKEAGLFHAFASCLAEPDSAGTRGWSVKNAQVRLVASAAAHLCRAVGIYEGFLSPSPDGSCLDALGLKERNGEASRSINAAIGTATAPPAGHGSPTLLGDRDVTLRIFNQSLQRVDRSAVAAGCKPPNFPPGRRLT